jgi:hypothetical protein
MMALCKNEYHNVNKHQMKVILLHELLNLVEYTANRSIHVTLPRSTHFDRLHSIDLAVTQVFGACLALTCAAGLRALRHLLSRRANCTALYSNSLMGPTLTNRAV